MQSKEKEAEIVIPWVSWADLHVFRAHGTTVVAEPPSPHHQRAVRFGEAVALWGDITVLLPSVQLLVRCSDP